MAVIELSEIFIDEILDLLWQGCCLFTLGNFLSRKNQQLFLKVKRKIVLFKKKEKKCRVRVPTKCS